MTQATGIMSTTFNLPLVGPAPIPWRYMAAADHRIEFLNATGAIVGAGAHGTAFTIAPEAAAENGGALTLLAVPPATATQLRLTRATAMVQLYDAPPGLEGIEQQLDRHTLTLQELASIRETYIDISDSVAAAHQSELNAAASAEEAEAYLAAAPGSPASLITVTPQPSFAGPNAQLALQQLAAKIGTDIAAALATYDAGIGDLAYANLVTFSLLDPSLVRTSAEGFGVTLDTEIVTAHWVDQMIPAKLGAVGAAPIYACRAWVNFNGTGTVAIRASANVLSITDNGTGDYTINFATPMIDANYVAVGTARRASTTASRIFSADVLLAGSLRCSVMQHATGLDDVDTISVAIFR